MRSMGRRLVLCGLGAALALGGCVSTKGDVVRKRAAYDFSCAEDQIQLTEIAGDTWGAKGCQKEAVYNCSRGAGGVVSACVPEK